MIPDTLSPPLRACLEGPPPRATGFIVTIYGDVAEPRGGTLWMGTLIETCADHGISESLARTAVSRLVGSGRLAGERVGRRSYYRLTDAARAEFRQAAGLFYDPPAPARGWLIAPGATDLPDDLSAVCWARVAPDLAMAPDRADVTRPAGALLTATADAGRAPARAFAAAHWPLKDVADAYRTFLRRFVRMAGALAGEAPKDGAASLALRLRLVHAYRQAVLSDPRLPSDVLPPDWPGPEARRLFAEVYLALSPVADSHVGANFHGADGHLAAETEATSARLAALATMRD
ncbi:PaaX family transcriptional regulator C-terminal domain-containing protein [Roseivivax marinus]|uniref:PaaX family transcriptional regulator C-terminal domain-containing protein n=1 Tax=Roseivivax marinus TaxID=1379903 RepID=UPI00273F834D|nr:PaaX family transcriptional regulator C-terminal domain-containing protein [Roseivivax marinus]